MKPSFKPTIYLFHPYLQTIACALIKFIDNQLTYRVENVNLSSEGHNSLAWADYPNLPVPNKERNNIIAVILPGLTGSCEDHYVKDIAKNLLEQGFQAVVYQPRFNGETLILPGKGYLNILEDFTEAMDYLKNKTLGSKYIAVGHSYGANLLVNYLGRKNEKNIFQSAVSLANPCNIILSECKLRNTYIEKLITKSLIRNGCKADHALSNSNRFGIDIEKLKKIKHVREFDREFVIKVYGYEKSEDYYWNLSCIRYLKDVKIPLLMIQAEDDPVVEVEGIPREQVEREDSRIIVLITKYGGHQGWIEGFLKLRRWYMKPTIEFLNACI